MSIADAVGVRARGGKFPGAKSDDQLGRVVDMDEVQVASGRSIQRLTPAKRLEVGKPAGPVNPSQSQNHASFAEATLFQHFFRS
jgi:hypothetical protein